MKRLWILGLAMALACGDDDGGTDGGGGRDSGGGVDSGTDSGGAEDSSTDAPLADVGVDSARMDAGMGGECATGALPRLATEMLDHRFAGPVFVTAAPGDPDTLFVVEKGGRVVVWREGAVLDTPFIELDGLLTDGEQGLLGLAFHPDYDTNGRFFLFFTPGRPRFNVVAEFRRAEGERYVADPEEVERLVEIADTESNHNGGMIAFGPDGFLYVATGDEGGGGDRHGTIGNGLDRTNLFGAILRLDVDAPGANFAAAGNPFTMPEGQPQIWAYGLRNPWRFSFDRRTGDMYIGDVGQGRWEEVTVLPAEAPGGANLGWRAYEGNEVFDEGTVSLVPEHTSPAIVYPHGEIGEPLGPVGTNTESVTGGYVYRGSAIPALQGWYLYADIGSATVGAFSWCDGEVTGHVPVDGIDVNAGIASFGEDGSGEMYIANIQSGRIFRVVAP
ncbi:MAG: PQQ-dependent sugar dehydrogenase [Myxococcota bacterium]